MRARATGSRCQLPNDLPIVVAMMGDLEDRRGVGRRALGLAPPEKAFFLDRQRRGRVLIADPGTAAEVAGADRQPAALASVS